MERAHLTRTEEFYKVMDSSFTIPKLTDKLPNQDNLYGTFRSHQTLSYLTPRECLEYYSEDGRKEVTCN